LIIGHICPIFFRCEGTSSSGGFSATPGIAAYGSSGGPTSAKGSHGILILGDRRTVVRNPKDELKTGTLHAMLRQLGLSREDI
jgi:mRNA interferase HicA